MEEKTSPDFQPPAHFLKKHYKLNYKSMKNHIIDLRKKEPEYNLPSHTSKSLSESFSLSALYSVSSFCGWLPSISMEPTTKEELMEGVLKQYKLSMISIEVALSQIKSLAIDSRIGWERQQNV